MFPFLEVKKLNISDKKNCKFSGFVKSVAGSVLSKYGRKCMYVVVAAPCQLKFIVFQKAKFSIYHNDLNVLADRS